MQLKFQLKMILLVVFISMLLLQVNHGLVSLLLLIINIIYNVLWLCEQKSILIEQFNKKSLEEKGYVDIYKKFIVINYSEIKPKKD